MFHHLMNLFMYSLKDLSRGVKKCGETHWVCHPLGIRETHPSLSVSLWPLCSFCPAQPSPALTSGPRVYSALYFELKSLFLASSTPCFSNHMLNTQKARSISCQSNKQYFLRHSEEGGEAENIRVPEERE